MAYVVVTAALLCLAIKGYCGKKTSGYVKNTGDSFFFNLLRMLFCILIGGALVFIEGAQASLRAEPGMLLICLLAGASNAAFLAGWLLAIQNNSLVSVDVCLTLGSIIPALLCACFFGEAVSLPKMLGFAMILTATVILAGHSKKTTGRSWFGILLLIIAAVGDGMSGFAQQLYRQFYTEAGSLSHGTYYPKTVYHFYTYVFAAILLFVLLLVFRATKGTSSEADKREKEPLTLSASIVLYIFIMAVCLFAANYLQTIATNDYGMPSQVLYPIIKGGCLVVVNFMAMIFFGEKMTPRSIFGSLVALCGIISMSIL